MRPIALTIAGSDSGAGAGIQADLKTFAALGVYGTTAITAVTAQNTMAVEAIEILSPGLVYDQIKAVATDFIISAAKTGMLGSVENIEAVARAVQDFGIPNLVIDTVMISKSGHRLLEAKAESALVQQLIPLATIITPNLPEAEVILQRKIASLDEMEKAAGDLKRLGPRFVLLKGGHLSGRESTDIFYDGETFVRLEANRINTQSTHGTGCTLSAAIAANLAKGFLPHESCAMAKQYLTEAIRSAESMGHGHGPVNHFWKVNF